MSDIQTAVGAIRKMAQMFEPMTRVADALDQIGALDNAKKEHERDLAALAGKKAKLLKDIAAETARLEQAKATVEAEIQTRSVLAGEMIASANKETAVIVEQAKSQAANIVAQALTDAATGKATLSAQLVEVQKQLAASQGELDQAVKSKLEAEAELNQIETKLAQAKSKVAALLS